jgi:putative hydrolase of the HAD superfamily
MRIVCFFDAFGTILHPDPDAATVYSLFAQRYGDPRNAATIRQELQRALKIHLGIQAGGATSAELEKDRWRSVVSSVFANLPQPDQLFAELWDYFSEPKHWQLFPDVVEAVESLREAGVVLGIASNFDQRLHGICAGFRALDHFPWILSSADLGWRKPAPQFFDTLARHAELAATNHWVVGDDPQMDLIPAQACGWRTVLIDRRQNEAIVQSAANTSTIQSLKYLPSVLLS